MMEFTKTKVNLPHALNSLVNCVTTAFSPLGQLAPNDFYIICLCNFLSE